MVWINPKIGYIDQRPDCGGRPRKEKPAFDFKLIAKALLYIDTVKNGKGKNTGHFMLGVIP